MKVLKITKPDKTVHVVPKDNLAFYQGYNNRQPEGSKWKIDEIEEEEAKNLPFIDPNHLTGAEAQSKVADLTKVAEEKDAEIEALKAELAAKKSGKLPADVAISLIATATEEQIAVLIKDEERKTVKDAAEKRLAELKTA